MAAWQLLALLLAATTATASGTSSSSSSSPAGAGSATARSVSSRLRAFNRAILAAPLPFESRATAATFGAFAAETARLAVPRTGLVTHDFPAAVTRVLPVFGVTRWAPLFDLRVAFLTENKVAVLADVVTEYKDGCLLGEAVAARMHLNDDAYVTSLELSSDYASSSHRDAAKCNGGVAPEPDKTAADTATLIAHHQTVMQRLAQLKDFGSWLNGSLADDATVQMAGQAAPFVGRQRAAAAAFPYALESVGTSVRRSYVIDRDTVMADVTLLWRPKHCSAFAARALFSLQYTAEGAVQELEVYYYEHHHVAKYLQPCAAAAAAATAAAEAVADSGSDTHSANTAGAKRTMSLNHADL